jgi:ubiquinone/menaquinone biosynthesis C-methylase UbiE
MKWDKGIDHELDFWNEWYRTRGLEWPDDYLFRLDSNAEIQTHVAAFLKTGKERILDVGAGPLTVLGKKWQGCKLEITACDALADAYRDMNKLYMITPLIITEKCKAENLTNVYRHNSFDIVHAQNSIDHCEDPFDAITQMLFVLKRGGVMLLRHEVNEAENENYKGFHQWNLYEQHGHFMIGDKRFHGSINNLLCHAGTIETKIEAGYIYNTIWKK